MTERLERCLSCGGPNKNWPYGLCPACLQEKKRRDAAYDRALSEHNVLSWMAQRMMR